MTTTLAFRRLSPQLILAAALATTGCTGVQSALEPGGYHAERIASLFWWMTGVGVVVWLFVIALALCYVRTAGGEKNHCRDAWLIVRRACAEPDATLRVVHPRRVGDDSLRLSAADRRLAAARDRAGVSLAVLRPGRRRRSLRWQHLFWLFGYPEVYIVFLPAVALVAMIAPTFARTGRRLLAGRAGRDRHRVSQLRAVGPPHVHHGAARRIARLPFGSLVIFLLGGLTGVMVAIVPFDFQAHDTFFVVGRFHYVLIGGALFPIFAGCYSFDPLINGKALSERLGRRMMARCGSSTSRDPRRPPPMSLPGIAPAATGAMARPRHWRVSASRRAALRVPVRQPHRLRARRTPQRPDGTGRRQPRR